MGITIDKAIDRLEDLHFEQDNWEYGELTEDCLLNREALRLATNTIRKYQKIKEIMNELNGNFYGSYIKDRLTLEKIYEVIEDGECK